MSRLDRFKGAQNARFGGFDSALREIRSGAKTGHWIWYVFPQIRGLGRSRTSEAFAIGDEAEAADYLRDTELRSRLVTIAGAVAEQLNPAPPIPLDRLMGSHIDAMKVVSSLTLFGAVAKKLAATDGADVYEPIAVLADEILRIASSQGYAPCAYTLRRLADDHDVSS